MALTEEFMAAADEEARTPISTGGRLIRLQRETDTERLTNLLHNGVLTQAEFDAAHRRLLARTAPSVVPASAVPTPDTAPCSPATKS